MKKNLLSYFFLSHKFHKIEYYAIFEMLKKKFRPIFQIVEVFTQKIFNMLSNIWVWDPRSGIRKKPIPDPGSGGQKGTGSRIRIRNTAQNCAKQAMRKFTATTAFTRTTWKYSWAKVWELNVLVVPARDRLVVWDAARVELATIPSSHCGSVILNYGSGLPINYGSFRIWILLGQFCGLRWNMLSNTCSL